MNSRGEKWKLVLLGALATIALELLFVRLRPIPERRFPCPSAIPMRELQVAKAELHVPQPLLLDAFDRLQRVLPAGRRNIFAFVETRRPADSVRVVKL